MRLFFSITLIHLALVAGAFFFHIPEKKMRPKKAVVRTLVLAPPVSSKQPILSQPVQSPKNVQSPPLPPTKVAEKQKKEILPKEKSETVVRNQEPPKIKKDEKKISKENTVKKAPQKSTTSRNANQEKLLSLMQESLKTLDQTASSSKQNSKTSSPQSTKKVDKELSCLLIAESNYEEILVQYLQSQLSFPEKGDVKIKLTLQRSGKIDQIAILESSNEKNRAYIQNAISSLLMPDFGSHFKGKNKHTFLITLTSKNSR